MFNYVLLLLIQMQHITIIYITGPRFVRFPQEAIITLDDNAFN